MCEWSAWFRAHHSRYDKQPSDFDPAAWQMNHTPLLTQTRDKLETTGYAVSIEGQNEFKLRGSGGVILSGKPDLIALQGKTALIVDIKTGEPQAFHAIQVMIYMWVIPLAASEHKGRVFGGRVVYRDHKVKIQPEEIDGDFKDRLKALLRRVGGPDECRKVPIRRECGFCPIAATECPERIRVVEPEPTDTDEF